MKITRKQVFKKAYVCFDDKHLVLTTKQIANKYLFNQSGIINRMDIVNIPTNLIPLIVKNKMTLSVTDGYDLKILHPESLEIESYPSKIIEFIGENYDKF